MNMKDKILARHAQYDARVHTLLQELAPLSDDLLNRKPMDGGWSAIQTLHHLILVEENSMAYLRKKLSFGPVLEKPGLSAWARSLLLRITLQSPIKFKAPKAAGNERLPEHATFSETEAKWQKTRAEWFVFFEKMPPELLDKAVYKHPRAGRLSWVQTLDFFISHFDRHRAQVQRAVL